jgi:hypothetical protein
MDAYRFARARFPGDRNARIAALVFWEFLQAFP